MRPHELAEVTRAADGLQELAARMDGLLPQVLQEGGVAKVLRGEGLGHPLHPILTDRPLGCFTSATLLDLVGRGSWARAANILVGVGVASSVPTMLSGLAEWRIAPAEERPVMLVHASLNVVAIGAYVASISARRRRRHGIAASLSVVGSRLAAAGGCLGGHLAFARRVGGPRP